MLAPFLWSGGGVCHAARRCQKLPRLTIFRMEGWKGRLRLPVYSRLPATDITGQEAICDAASLLFPSRSSA